MTEFLEIIFSAPTLFFTVPLSVAMLYWVTVLVGGLDMDLFDGAVDGAVDGALDGVVDGAVDGVVDGALDGALDGVAEGAVDGAVDGVADGADVGDVMDGAGGFSLFAFLASVLRLGKVPATFAISAFLLWGWSAAFLLAWLHRHSWLQLVPVLAFSILGVVAATMIGGALTNVTMRPIEPVFAKSPSRKRSDLVGEECELATSRTDERFGQAVVRVDGDVLKVAVRCDQTYNQLRRGDRALIVNYDRERRAYVVEPLHPSGTDTSSTTASTRARGRTERDL